MRALVIDGSIMLALLLKEERSSLSAKAITAVEQGTPGYVPSHWHLETANGLLIAERRKRVAQADVVESLQAIQLMSVIIDDETASRCNGDIVALARQYALTAYDAAYLELALRRKATLATLDHALAKAAVTAGVDLLV